MSTCISRAGEYSAHETEPGNYICDRCGVLDEEGIFAELDTLRAKVAADIPVNVAQDATDATETPARTPGGSGTAEARTEAPGEREARYAEAMADADGGSDLGCFPADYASHARAAMTVADAERESATDPGMTNLEAELVALRAQVEQAEHAGKQWMDRALTAEAQVGRVEAQADALDAMADELPTEASGLRLGARSIRAALDGA